MYDDVKIYPNPLLSMDEILQDKHLNELYEKMLEEEAQKDDQNSQPAQSKEAVNEDELKPEDQEQRQKEAMNRFRKMKAASGMLSKSQIFYKQDAAKQGFNMPFDSFVPKGTFVVQEKYFMDVIELGTCFKFLRAGPFTEVAFKKQDVRAAIVTCGGLCPGLNTVIKSIVQCLSYEYGVRTIWGVRWGYQGFYEEPEKNWVKLDEKFCETIHKMGGTVLGSSRGGFDSEKIIAALQEKQINQLYVIGGDGTHRGIHRLQEELRKKNVRVSICGIPKTIDNDIPLIDRSFGFATAVEESIKFIDSAVVESGAAENGVGIIRLMGRHCGYIAVNACLASRDVNICLIPEVHF